jgi:outer membrane lipoprotein-sorting protein
MRKGILILALVLLAVLPASQVLGEATPEAQKWLDKLAKVHDDGPFKVHYSSTMQAAQMGQSITIEMDGDITQGGERHQRMTMKGAMKMPGMETPMEMNILAVSDGDTVWTEIHHPMMGKQVMKIGIDAAAELSQTSGFTGTGVDPIGQIRQMTEAFDLDVAGQADGVVTLVATMTEETREKLGSAMPALGDDMQLELMLDEKTGFPSGMKLGGEGAPLVSMTFSDFERLDPEGMDKDLFVYTPPEGATVTDLGAMAGAAAGP